MKASELRDISDSASSSAKTKEIKRIEDEMLRAANEGFTELGVAVSGPTSVLFGVKDHFEILGYTVKTLFPSNEIVIGW